MAARLSNQRFICGAELGVNSSSLATSVSSEWFDSEGFNQATLTIDYTYGAGTSLSFYMNTTEDLSGTPTGHRLQSVSIAAGTATLSDLAYSKTTGASKSFTVNIPLNYKGVQFVFSSGGTPTSSDLITATVRLGVV